MGIKDNCEMAPIIQGSKERSLMLYLHKFKLALVDLQRRCSEYALVPPLEDEKMSYDQVLDNIAPPLDMALLPPSPDENHERDVNVYSDELYGLYLERIYQEAKDLMRRCAKIKDWILKNLSLRESWESILKLYEPDKYEETVASGYLVEFKKAIAEKYQVSNDDLPNYISQVDHCCTIALTMNLHVTAHCNDASLPSWHINGSLDKLALGWDALHALTFLKRGSSVGNVLREHCALRNPKENASVELELHSGAISKHDALLRKEEDENLQTLWGIIEDLKRIGDSNVELDKEELALVRNIWGSVASSTHFFISAMAYEQTQCFIQRRELFDVGKLGLRKSLRRKKNIDALAIDEMEMCLVDDVYDLETILIAYKEVLIEKLRNL